jgi:hypothetical protein
MASVVFLHIASGLCIGSMLLALVLAVVVACLGAQTSALSSVPGVAPQWLLHRIEAVSHPVLLGRELRSAGRRRLAIA